MINSDRLDLSLDGVEYGEQSEYCFTLNNSEVCQSLEVKTSILSFH